MMLRALSESLPHTSTREVVGAFAFAVTAAMVATGVFWLLRHKASDRSGLVGALTLATAVAGVVFTAAYYQHSRLGSRNAGAMGPMPRPPLFGARQGGAWPPWSPSRGSWPAVGAMPSTGTLIVIAADTDHDRRVSLDELTEFLRKADPDSKGWAEAGEIDRAVRAGLHAAAPGGRALARSMPPLGYPTPHDTAGPPSEAASP
jgi:hypothetical protein